MQRWAYVWVVTTALLPLAALVVVALQRVRPSRSWRRSVAEVGMVFGTLPWIWMILTPVRVPPETKMFHWVPLSDIVALAASGQALVQVGGNLAVLFGFGFFASMRWPGLRPWQLLAAGACGSLGLEVLQRLLATGRVFSVDDILLNAVGCLLGGLALRLIRPPAPAPTPR